MESGSARRAAPPQQATNVMRTAKAAVCQAPNTPFVIKQYPLRPVRPREVLVRVKMATICRSDIHSYEGRRPNPFPGILGHEIIGPELTRIAAKHPSVGEVRGLGVFWAIELVRNRETRDMLVPYNASGAAADSALMRLGST